jgi:enoyl-CoA hydratase
VYNAIEMERDGDVLVVTLDRPDNPLNAVNGSVHAEITALFAELRRERVARAILLTARGTAFSAGGDIGWFPTLQEPGALEELRLDAKQLIWDLVDIPLPVVCALNGPAIGLGASIALLCDVIFMASDATIADPHVRVGVVAGDGGTVAWPLAVGPARAKQYLLTGDPITAEEAERIGLVNFVCPPESVVAKALAFAQRLAAGAPLAVQYTKLAVNKLVKDALNTSFDAATALEISTFRSADHAEALAAWREKRTPRFEGR